jgi:hypothetical protein
MDEIKKLCAELRNEVAFQQGDATAWGVDTYGDLPRNIRLLNEAASALERVCRELETAQAALEPFAKVADIFTDRKPQNGDTIHSWEFTSGSAELRYSDCVRARKALSEAAK